MSATARIDDLLELDSLLTPEDIELRQTVRRFGEQRLRPHIADWFEAGEVPVRELASDLGKLGVLGMHLEGYGCGGSSATAYGLVCQELEAVDSGLRSLVSVQGSLAMFAIHRARQRGAAQAVAACDGHRRRHRLLRADRAGLRLQSRAACAPPRAATAPTGSSTVRRCGSPTGRSPTSRWCGHGPTRASSASWCPPRRRDSPQAR